MSRFYVYTLTDPRDGEIFYVGKGSGNRIAHHEREAKAGGKSKKCDRIREIWADGRKVIRREVKRFADEREAYAYEAELIEQMAAQLTNQAPGGMGAWSKPLDGPDQHSLANAKMCALAILAKYAPKDYGSKLWAQAIQKALIKTADEVIAKFFTPEYMPLIEKELLCRGIVLKTNANSPNAIPAGTVG